MSCLTQSAVFVSVQYMCVSSCVAVKMKHAGVVLSVAAVKS